MEVKHILLFELKGQRDSILKIDFIKIISPMQRKGGCTRPDNDSVITTKTWARQKVNHKLANDLDTSDV